MLDYSSIEVLSQCYKLNDYVKFYLLLILMIWFLMALGIHINPEYSFFDGLIILAVPVFVCLFLILFLARGDIKLSLVRIGTKDIKMSSTVFPPSDDYPRLKKEGDKVYYYTYVRSENVSSPYKVKEEVQKEFDKTLFDLQNQKK